MKSSDLSAVLDPQPTQALVIRTAIRSKGCTRKLSFNYKSFRLLLRTLSSCSLILLPSLPSPFFSLFPTLFIKMIITNIVTHLLGSAVLVSGVIARTTLRTRGSTPSYPYDTKTTEYCTWWHDYDQQTSCDEIIEGNFITLKQFQRWVGHFILSNTQN